jgi:hypothetical protein
VLALAVWACWEGSAANLALYLETLEALEIAEYAEHASGVVPPRGFCVALRAAFRNCCCVSPGAEGPGVL